MLREDLEKRLDEIEAKIEELEDSILDNRLKIMEMAKSMAKKSGPELVTFDRPVEKVEPEPRKPVVIRKTAPSEDAEMPSETDDFRTRARKIKQMLRELE